MLIPWLEICHQNQERSHQVRLILSCMVLNFETAQEMPLFLREELDNDDEDTMNSLT